MALFSVMGFSFSGAAPNQGIMFARLKPFDERPGAEHSAAGGARTRLRAAVRRSPARSSFRSRRRRSRASAGSAGSSSRCSTRRGTDINAAGGGDAGRRRRAATSRRGCAGCSARSPPTIRSCMVDDRPAAGAGARACRSARSRARCRSSSARSTSTTSSSTTAPTASTCRPTSSSAPSPQALGSSTRGRATARWCRSSSVVTREGDDGAAGHQPLQPVPVGDDQRIGGARASAPAGAAGDGADRRADAAAGHGLRLVGHLARGDQGRAAVVPDLRPRRCCSST